MIAIILGAVIPFILLVIRREWRLYQFEKDRQRRELWKLRSQNR